jgi:hypothetical protein
MLDAYHLNKEETDLIEARKLGDPIIIQRLIILKRTIEQDYMTDYVHKEGGEQTVEQDYMTDYVHKEGEEQTIEQDYIHNGREELK